MDMKNNNILDQIGQLFIIGFHGKEPPLAFLEFLKENNIGGVILFEENCPSHQKAKDNIREIQAQYNSSTPFIAIDQEGGRVSRLRGAPAEFKGAYEYGKSGKIEQFCEEYSRAVLFMDSIGINLNLAPVCDILLNKENKCTEGRCFGETPDIVKVFVEAAVRTSKKTRMLSCLKHFPGLGASAIDPHLETATADYDLETWQYREKIPFVTGVSFEADMIMTTHLHLPNIDDTIVTGSKKIISEMLRQHLSFDGPVITDDLTMSGAESLGELGPRTITAFEAGHDILLFGADFDKFKIAYKFFCEAVKRGDVDENRIKKALNRIGGLKFKLDRTMIY